MQDRDIIGAAQASRVAKKGMYVDARYPNILFCRFNFIDIRTPRDNSEIYWRYLLACQRIEHAVSCCKHTSFADDRSTAQLGQGTLAFTDFTQ